MNRIAVLLLASASAAAPVSAASLQVGTFAPGETIAPPAGTPSTSAS